MATSFFRFLWCSYRARIAILGSAALLLALGVASWLDTVRPRPVDTVRRPSVVATRVATQPATAHDQLLQHLGHADLGLPELLHRTANASDMSLDEVRYETRPERGLPVVARVASFTLIDSYAQIRHFTQQLLQAQRNLALDAFDCTREDIDTADVNCDIRVIAFEPATAGNAQP